MNLKDIILSEIRQSQKKTKKQQQKLTQSQERGGQDATYVCPNPKKALNRHVLLVSKHAGSACLE